MLKIDFKKLNLHVENKQFGRTEPLLIHAFHENESADAIPIELTRKFQAIMLPVKEAFRNMAKDKTG